MLKSRVFVCLGALFILLQPLAWAQGAASTQLQDAPIVASKGDQHAALSGLLNRYVKTYADGINRVDYAAWAASKTDRKALSDYIAGFAGRDLSEKSDANFAAWANLYNAVTVQHILERYPVKSIRDGYLTGPWKEVEVVVGGRTVSLDAIEHDILRKIWGTPDVHYAINCASYSCPNLPRRAWEASTLRRDLDQAARDYINNSRGVSITPKGLVVSSIYDWFQQDFGGSKAKVVEHLLAYADPERAAQIRANPKIVRFRYDWSLNDQPKPKNKS